MSKPTILFKLPYTLANECRQFACPDAWGRLVVKHKRWSNVVIVWVEEDNMSSLMQAIASAVRMACDQRFPSGHRWKKGTLALIDRLTNDLHHIDLSLATNQLT